MELDQARIDRLRGLSSAAGGGAVLIGVMAMIGWILGVDALKSVVPGLVTMKANTALAFILLGTALHIGAKDDGRHRMVGRGATVAVLALAATVFSQFVHGRDLGVDLFLFDEPKGTAGTVHPGRMALNTSLCFILASVALLTLDVRGRWAALAPMLGLFVGAAALFALVGYLAGLTNFYGIPTQTQMAVPTAVGMLLLGGGLIASRADRGPMRLCASDGAGGTLVRHILPGAVAGILVLTVLRLAGQNAGLYGTTIGAWLLASSYIVLLVTIVWRAGWSMEHTDSQRRAMANELKRLSERDPLTGLFNRRRLHEELVRQIAVLERHGRGFAVLMLDLDASSRSTTPSAMPPATRCWSRWRTSSSGACGPPTTWPDSAAMSS